uniref:Uncharacterized protein n=1 Tax=Corethron hystrix TaxID=216773 RepID=A0A7S1FQZ2_9STRA|mmetsp:Transcript_21758/g.49488  ORF Transcript_21758/g.49488 Transcript_21758/m.49488 type:complete len:140 (+) Transcript_21758:196-615(+)
MIYLRQYMRLSSYRGPIVIWHERCRPSLTCMGNRGKEYCHMSHVTQGVVIKKPEAFVLESPEPVQLGPKARAEMRAPPPQVLPRFNSGSGLPPGFITPAPVALPPEDDLPPPVYAPQQLQRTDSDLAREMQAKFDMHGQ